MPPKKMVSSKMCDQVIKVQSKNAVNAYKQKSKGKRSSPNEYAIFVKQHMQQEKMHYYFLKIFLNYQKIYFP